MSDTAFLHIEALSYAYSNSRRVVDLWSNGIFGPPGSAPIEYGVGVATVDTMLDYVPAGISAVPEPESLALLLGGLGFVGTALRRRVPR